VKTKGYKIIEGLVKKFESNLVYYQSGEYNETQVRSDFINPFLKALGWDVDNKEGKLNYLRDVVEEDTVEVDEDGEIRKKKPDYALRYNGKRKLFLEVKKPSISLHSNKTPAFQLRRYGWSATLPISILTNFETLIIYDCRYSPIEEDDVRVARVKEYNFKEFLTHFDEIYEELSFESVSTGKFDQKYNTDTIIKGQETFDSYFLDQIEKWRVKFASNLLKRNPVLKTEEVNFLVQKLINRIVFLRICEDREIEKYKKLLEVNSYESLKSLFIEADKKYNSGLFDFIEDRLSLDVNIDSDILIDVFQELYYPNSPYTFSVVESNVLGEIYELFLANEIVIHGDSSISVTTKPEVAESNGVVTTPKHIVDSIVSKTLAPLIINIGPDKISGLRIADISCGSGVFLLSAFEYLLEYHLEWYVRTGTENYPDLVYEFNGEYYLTLYEKQRILTNNLFGVDIDDKAVEVTQFSLLLKVLEDENGGSVNEAIKKHRLKALPNLDNNILVGNSLVDYSYYEINNEDELNANQIININPFNWEDEFPEIITSNGGFDAIIGNPPYIRIQNMQKYSPKEVNFFKNRLIGYKCAASDNFDKYSLFIERGLSLLNKDGYLGYIVPNKFLTIKSGKTLRSEISEGKHLTELVHFGTEQVFKRRSTYTCIMVLAKDKRDEFTVEHVTDLKAWEYGIGSRIQGYKAKEIGEEPWIFLHPRVKNVFNKMIENNNVLSDVANIFVGVQTSKDEIYVISPESETNEKVTFTGVNGKRYEIEKGVLRPMIYDVALEGFSRPKANTYLIFPYKELRDRRAIPYSEDELANAFPKCFKYLNDFKESLLTRSVQGFTNNTWFRFGRSQSLVKFNGSKLIWPVLSKGPKYTFDDQDIMFSGGGNGPYYGLNNKENDNHSIHYIQAVLSHPIVETIIRTGKTSVFRGGYYSHGKQFIEGLPFRAIDFENPSEVEIHDKVVRNVKDIIAIKDELNSISIPQQRKKLSRQVDILIRKNNEEINQLFELSNEDLSTIAELT